MPDQVRDTSSSYLVELRKLATQKRENHREDDRVGQYRGEAGLTGTEHTTRARGQREKETGAEGQEECGSDEQVGLGEHETHGLGDETEHKEEHECVEKNSHLVGFAVRELDVFAGGGHENTGAEREKKGSGDSDFLGRDIGKHLL